MKGQIKKDLIPLGVLIGILLITALLTALFTNTSIISWISVFFAAMLYFFIPGYMILIFVNITSTERVILSFFAGGIVSSVVFYLLNIMGFVMTRFSVFLVVIGIVIILGIIYAIYGKKIKHNS